MTDAEKEYAIQQAKLANLSVTTWVRKAAFSKRSLILPETTPMHRAYYKQLVGMSNNINQITKKLNQGRYTKILTEIEKANTLLEKITKLLINDRQAD
nr:plasmid mobilization relaxosome protein MobC [Marinilabilia salmonicolor]